MNPRRLRSPWPGWRSPDLRLLRRVVLIAVGAFLIGYVASSLWMWIGSSGPTVATVPNLKDLSLDDARRVAERADLVMEPADSLPHPEVAAGHVLTQSPLSGQEVAPGTAVQVILSSGRQRHAVPQVSGLSRERAEQVLVATGMEPMVQMVQDLKRPGLVVGTTPPAGSVLAVPASVSLLISSGPPLVAVPDLLGRQIADLPDLLGAAELVLGEVVRDLRLVELEGEVVEQQPAAGDSIPAGSPVDVVVATQRIDMLPPQEFR